MKTHPKPVRECHGCALNLSDRCAVFPEPVLKWRHRRCEGYNDPDLIREYEKSRDISGAHGRKQARAMTAQSARTVDHRNGRRPLAVR